MAQDLTAGPAFRATSPEGVTHETLEKDEPRLLKLLDVYTSLLIYTRSSPHYESVRAIFNTVYTKQPIAIIRPKNETEVAAALGFCAEHSLTPSIRCGGHDFAGRSLAGDVLIDARALDSITVAEDKKSARVGGGVISSTLLGFLETFKLFTPVGFCPEVGYAGWATGGGYGYYQAEYGLGVDNILGAKIVTPSGDVVDTKDDEELLWAMRGAGTGGFGVVLELTVKLYRRPKVMGGMVLFPLAEGVQIFQRWNELYDTELPDRFAGDFSIARIPGGPAIMTALIAWTLNGEEDKATAKSYIDKLSSAGTVIMSNVEETTPHALCLSMDTNAVRKPSRYRTMSVSAVSPTVVNILVDMPPVTSSSFMIAHHTHGRAVEPNPAACFANRTPHYVFGAQGELTGDSLTNYPNVGDAVWSDLLASEFSKRGLSMEKAYMNFSQPEECDVVKFYGKEAADRLRALKRKYDPLNLLAVAYPALA